MNQVFSASIVLIFTVGLWVFGRRPSNQLTQKHHLHILKTIEGNQSSLVSKTKNSENKKINFDSTKEFSWMPPKTPLERINLKRDLNQSMNSGPSERLRAVTIASLWGHPSILPILRKGLKDANMEIVLVAAAGIAKHRCKSKGIYSEVSVRPPRNVALMR